MVNFIGMLLYTSCFSCFLKGRVLLLCPLPFTVYRRGLVQLKHFNFCCHISKLIDSS